MNPPTSPPDWLGDPRQIEDLRLQMLRFAQLQLADAHLAEDAVQEALLGAMAHAERFAARAAFKTWVFAILKNKLVDLLRQRNRLVSASELAGDDASDDALIESLFDQGGFWQAPARPQGWAQPEADLADAQMWRVFEACLEHLPAAQARAFMMREFIGFESAEICAQLELSVSNLNVMLHRARLRLRACLQLNWFGDEALA